MCDSTIDKTAAAFPLAAKNSPEFIYFLLDLQIKSSCAIAMTTSGREFACVETITLFQKMAQQERPSYSSLVLNYLAFATLGILCSLLFNSYYGTSGRNMDQYLHILSTLTQNTEYSLAEVREVLQRTDCEEVKREAKVPDNIKYFMASKLRYQFDSTVEDASSIGHCRAIKVSPES